MPVNLLVLLPLICTRLPVSALVLPKPVFAKPPNDLTVFLLDEGASVEGVFTQNRFCAAPFR